jgi:hypothetical protein
MGHFHKNALREISLNFEGFEGVIQCAVDRAVTAAMASVKSHHFQNHS